MADVGITLTRGSWVRQAEGIEVINHNTNKTMRYFDIANLRKLNLKLERSGDIRLTMSDGDRLDVLADQYYGNQMLWWVIAYRNDMTLPIMQINAGVKIVIPDPSYVRNLGL